jgi:hypothetical protein
MQEPLLPHTPTRRAPTYAIALLPFVLVVLVAIIALVRERLSPSPSAAAGADAGLARDGGC